MPNIYEAPDVTKVIDLILPTNIEYEGKVQTVDNWRKIVIGNVSTRRKQDKITNFNKFVCGLLEGYGTKGEYQENQRYQLMRDTIHGFSDVTEKNIQWILEKNGYYRKEKAIQIVLSARDIAQDNSFIWEDYFKEAESNWENGYKKDRFLKIKGIASTTKTSKTRDYAISEFSFYYCAIDRNVSRLITRTGLVLNGIGQYKWEYEFGTSPNDNYDFLKRLILDFSKQTGWLPNSSKGYSPKEIDYIFWLFSSKTGICKSNAECSGCPIKFLCLTYREMYKHFELEQLSKTKE